MNSNFSDKVKDFLSYSDVFLVAKTTFFLSLIVKKGKMFQIVSTHKKYLLHRVADGLIMFLKKQTKCVCINVYQCSAILVGNDIQYM